MFTVSKRLEAAVRQRDQREVKNAIINYINADPDNRTGDVQKAVRYVADQGMDFWEAHDPSMALKEDASQWTEEYEARLTADLHVNFSKERFAHWEAVAKAVGQKVQARKAAAQAADPAEHPSAPADRSGGSGNELMVKVAIGVAAAVAVAAIVAILLK